MLARFGGGFDRDGTSRIHRSPAALDREAACFEERDEAVGELALKFEGASKPLTRRADSGKLYVMNTKLTLRMDDGLVAEAKVQAERRGKSVSQMFGEFVSSLAAGRRREDLPPVTTSLLGILKGHRVSEADYKNHLREKYS